MANGTDLVKGEGDEHVGDLPSFRGRLMADRGEDLLLEHLQTDAEDFEQKNNPPMSKGKARQENRKTFEYAARNEIRRVPM